VSVSDNFNRANGDVGANWFEAQSSADVLSNACTPHVGGVLTQIYWAANSFNADQTSQFTMSTLKDYAGASVRMRGSGGTTSGYYAYVDGTGAGQIRRYDNGVDTVLASYSGAVAGTFQLSIVGNALTWFNNGSSIATATDSTYTSGGAPGIFFFDDGTATPVLIDDWSGTGEVGAGTRFYLPSTGSPAVTPAFGSGWDVTAAVRLMTSIVKQGTISAAVAFKGSGSNPNFSLGAQFVSVPLAAQTISGTVKGQMVTLDHAGQVTTLAVAIRLVDSTGADYGTVKHLVGPTPAASVSGSTPPVWPSVNNTNRQLLDSSDNPAIALTSRTAAAGDLLVIEIGGRVADTDSTFNRSPTAGDGSGSDLPEDNTTLTFFNPWVEFSQALTFLRSLPQIGLFDPDLRPEAWFDPGVAR
jgi:hypothetical protein